MINQFVVTLFFNWSSYDSDQTGFSYVNVHMQKQSLFYMPIKIFVKNSTIMVCCINTYLGTLL